MINQQLYFKAMISLGYDSFSIEPDGTVWLGTDDDRIYPNMDEINAKVAEIENAEIAAKQMLLDRLGLTAEEARLLLS